VKLADLAFGQRHDPHVGVAQPLEKASDVFLIARQSVERLGIEHVDPFRLGVGHQLLQRGSVRCARSADRRVRVDFDHRSAVPLDAFAADPHLIVDGRLALQVG